MYTVTAGTQRITPTVPVPLAGYSGRSKLAASIADDLEVNVIVLRSPDTTVVLASCDLLYLGNALRNELEQRLQDCIKPEHLFTAATHTHFAPATDPSLPLLGRVSQSYLTSAADRISTLIRKVLHSKGRPAQLTYRVGEGRQAISRRLPVFKRRLGILPPRIHCEMRPNVNAPIDERIHVLSFNDEFGRPLAVCWCYACHPVCYPNKIHVSADFPGVVRNLIRNRLGNIPVLFWQGFSGDVRPRAMRLPGQGLLNRWKLPKFVPFTLEQWQEWSAGLTANVLQAMETTAQTVTGDVLAVRRQLALSKLGSFSDDRSLNIHEVRLGSRFSIIGVSAELVSSYVAELEKTRPGIIVIPVNCLDGVPAYIPTTAMLSEGGYEVYGFMKLFGITGSFRHDVTKLVVQHVFSTDKIGNETNQGD